ncbi:hypothetical protein O5964_27325, partial [Escherichia coli]|nr:hypothetical protein [Escherichia coli]
IATKMKQYKFQGQYTSSDYIKTLTQSGSLPADMIAGGIKCDFSSRTELHHEQNARTEDCRC